LDKIKKINFGERRHTEREERVRKNKGKRKEREVSLSGSVSLSRAYHRPSAPATSSFNHCEL